MPLPLLDKIRPESNKKSNSGVLLGDFHQFILNNCEKIAIGG
jgi:hypothetical protein